MLLAASASALCAGSGHFVGHARIEWLDGGNGMDFKLLDYLAYEDPAGRTWMAPVGALIDGASIPPVFRSLIGPPLQGKYRKAALLHDHYTRQREGDWKAAHRMFYDASRTEGVSETEAKIMFMALYAAATRWEPRSSPCFNSCHRSRDDLSWHPTVTEVELRPVVEWIEEKNPALAEIESHLDGLIRRPGPHVFAQR